MSWAGSIRNLIYVTSLLKAEKLVLTVRFTSSFARRMSKAHGTCNHSLSSLLDIFCVLKSPSPPDQTQRFFAACDLHWQSHNFQPKPRVSVTSFNLFRSFPR